MRLVHFADAHLGFESGGRPRPDTGLSSRVHDVLDRIDEIASFVETEGADLVVFAGDAFRSPRPGPTLEALFAERVRRLAATVEVVLVAGCHDQPRAPGQRGPLDIYRILGVPGVTVVSEPAVVRAGGLAVACLPWGASADTVGDLAASTGTEDAILVAHVAVAGASTSTAQSQFDAGTGEPVDITALADPRFAYVGLGHVHRHQGDLNHGRRPYVAYSGALERIDFSEEGEDKGFLVVDIDGGELRGPPEFVPLAARQFRTIAVAVDPEHPSAVVAELAAGAADPTDAIIRVQVEGPRAALAELKQPDIVAAFPGAADVRIELRAPRPARSAPAPISGWRNEHEALDAWIAAHPDLPDPEHIRTSGRQLIVDVLGGTP